MSVETQLLGLPVDARRQLPARQLAYRNRAGDAPAVIWLGGFRSDMTSTKATALDEACAEDGRAMLRFDYYAHGESAGDFHAANLSIWLDDALEMIRRFGGPAPVLVGSSMGGWIALLATARLKAEGRAPSGLVLIAPAVDFTERLMWARFPEEIRQNILKDGVWYRPSAYSPEPYPITRSLIEDARQHLILDLPIHVGVPIHILQGAKDPDVPIQYVDQFVSSLSKDDVRMTIIPDGDHRLSRPEDIATLVRITRELVQSLRAAS
ncbi:MAG: alpha/beta hydrolase [Methylobacterium sp.]|nr:alpha/beta hydrolase [Methylobacterium sp.]